MPILVEADTTTAGVLATALPAGSQVVARADDVDALLNARGDSAVVLGPTVDMRTAASVADRVRSTHPATTVVLIRHELEPEVFAQAMQVGIGAVVAADDPVALGAALGRAQEHLGGDQRTRSESPTPTATGGCSPCSPPRAAWARPRWRSTSVSP